MLARTSSSTLGVTCSLQADAKSEFLTVQRFAFLEIFGADAAGIKRDQLIEFWRP